MGGLAHAVIAACSHGSLRDNTLVISGAKMPWVPGLWPYIPQGYCLCAYSGPLPAWLHVAMLSSRDPVRGGHFKLDPAPHERRSPTAFCMCASVLRCNVLPLPCCL